MNDSQRLISDLNSIARRCVKEWRTDVETLRALGVRMDSGVGSQGLSGDFKMRLAFRVLRAAK